MEGVGRENGLRREKEERSGGITVSHLLWLLTMLNPTPNTTTTQSPTLLPSLHITTSPAFFRLAEGWFLYSTVKIKPGVCVCCDFHRTRGRPPYCIGTVCNHKWCTRASAWLLKKPNCETYQSTVCKKTTKKTGKYLKQSHVLYTARLFMCAVCVRWVDKGWLTQHSHSVWIGAPSELKDGRKKITVATKDTAKRNGEKERRRWGEKAGKGRGWKKHGRILGESGNKCLALCVLMYCSSSRWRQPVVTCDWQLDELWICFKIR